MGILIAIIMFGSIALIGNSFSISVNERKRQYGLLSSIGATRKQLRRNVLYEASVLSALEFQSVFWLELVACRLLFTLSVI